MRRGYWSTKELRILRERAEAGVTAPQIALELGRTENAVEAQILRLRKRGDASVRKRKIPLHGLSGKGAHPIVQQILRVARRERYTYQSLSKKVGVSRSAINSLVSRNPSFMTVVAICDALEIKLTAHSPDEAYAND